MSIALKIASGKETGRQKWTVKLRSRDSTESSDSSDQDAEPTERHMRHAPRHHHHHCHSHSHFMGSPGEDTTSLTDQKHQRFHHGHTGHHRWLHCRDYLHDHGPHHHGHHCHHGDGPPHHHHHHGHHCHHGDGAPHHHHHHGHHCHHEDGPPHHHHHHGHHCHHGDGPPHHHHHHDHRNHLGRHAWRQPCGHRERQMLSEEDDLMKDRIHHCNHHHSKDVPIFEHHPGRHRHHRRHRCEDGQHSDFEERRRDCPAGCHHPPHSHCSRSGHHGYKSDCGRAVHSTDPGNSGEDVQQDIHNIGEEKDLLQITIHPEFRVTIRFDGEVDVHNGYCLRERRRGHRQPFHHQGRCKDSRPSREDEPGMFGNPSGQRPYHRHCRHRERSKSPHNRKCSPHHHCQRHRETSPQIFADHIQDPSMAHESDHHDDQCHSPAEIDASGIVSKDKNKVTEPLADFGRDFAEPHSLVGETLDLWSRKHRPWQSRHANRHCHVTGHLDSSRHPHLLHTGRRGMAANTPCQSGLPPCSQWHPDHGRHRAGGHRRPVEMFHHHRNLGGAQQGQDQAQDQVHELPASKEDGHNCPSNEFAFNTCWPRGPCGSHFLRWAGSYRCSSRRVQAESGTGNVGHTQSLAFRQDHEGNPWHQDLEWQEAIAADIIGSNHQAQRERSCEPDQGNAPKQDSGGALKDTDHTGYGEILAHQTSPADAGFSWPPSCRPTSELSLRLAGMTFGVGSADNVQETSPQQGNAEESSNLEGMDRGQERIVQESSEAASVQQSKNNAEPNIQEMPHTETIFGDADMVTKSPSAYCADWQ